MNTPKFIIVHSSDVPSTRGWNQLSGINAYHREQGFPISTLGYYVGYHVLLTGGNLIKTKEDNEAGVHTSQIVDGKSMNFQSLGICIAFDGDIEQIPVAYIPLLRKQIKEWMQKYNIPLENVLLHRSFATKKTCPGSLISIENIHNIINDSPKEASQEEKREHILKLMSIIEQLKEILRQYQKKLGL